MKNNIIYSFSILIIEIGLLLQWFTLRRITMIVVFFILIFLTSPIVVLLNNWFVPVIGFINGILFTRFIMWNFKKENNAYKFKEY